MTPSPRPIRRRIRELDPTEISLVDVPANFRKFIVTKRAQMTSKDTTGRDDVLARVDKIDPAVEAKIEALLARTPVRKAADSAAATELTPGALAALRAVGRILAPYASQISEDDVGALMGELGMLPPVSPDDDGEAGEGEGDDGEASDDAEGTDDAEGDSPDEQVDGETVEAGNEADALQLTKPDAVSQDDHDKAAALAQAAYNQGLEGGKSADEAHEAAKQAYLTALGEAGYTVQKQAKQKGEGQMGKVTGDSKGFSDAQLGQIEKMVASRVAALSTANKQLVEKSAKLEADLSVEREDRLAREFAQKAAQYEALGDPAEVSAILKSCHGDTEATQRIEAVLKSACEKINTHRATEGGLFGEIGSRLPAQTSGPEQELQQLVDGFVQKSAGEGRKAKSVAWGEVLKSQRGRELYAKTQNAKGF